MRRTSDRKQMVQLLWETGTRNIITIQNKTGTARATLFRWIAKLKKGESLDRKLYPNREKKITRLVHTKVIRKMKNKRQPSLRRIASSVNISHESVRSILKHKQYQFRKKQKKIRLNSERRLARLRFAEEMLDRESDWSFCFFSDEASIWLERAIPKGKWGKSSRDMSYEYTGNSQMMEIEERDEENDSSSEEEQSMEIEEEGEENSESEEEESDEMLTEGRHGPKLHFWGAISARGTTRLQIFEGRLNSRRYVRILRQRKGEMERLYPEGYWFQQDGSPCHTSQFTRNYLNQNFAYILSWPPYSPDMSPIENIWAWLKAEISKDRPSSIASLKRLAKKHWNRITPEFLAPYINSMSNRMRETILNRGGNINY